jgi:hypothetical protein
MAEIKSGGTSHDLSLLISTIKRCLRHRFYDAIKEENLTFLHETSELMRLTMKSSDPMFFYNYIYDMMTPNHDAIIFGDICHNDVIISQIKTLLNPILELKGVKEGNKDRIKNCFLENYETAIFVELDKLLRLVFLQRSEFKEIRDAIRDINYLDHAIGYYFDMLTERKIEKAHINKKYGDNSENEAEKIIYDIIKDHPKFCGILNNDEEKEDYEFVVDGVYMIKNMKVFLPGKKKLSVNGEIDIGILTWNGEAFIVEYLVEVKSGIADVVSAILQTIRLINKLKIYPCFILKKYQILYMKDFLLPDPTLLDSILSFFNDPHCCMDLYISNMEMRHIMQILPAQVRYYVRKYHEIYRDERLFKIDITVDIFPTDFLTEFFTSFV